MLQMIFEQLPPLVCSSFIIAMGEKTNIQTKPENPTVFQDPAQRKDFVPLVLNETLKNCSETQADISQVEHLPLS